MPSSRRHFLQTLSGTSMLAAAGAPMAFRGFDVTAAAHPQPRDDKFDVSWADHVQGKFRAVFDSPEVAEGAALFRAILWTEQYKQVYGTGRDEMSAVLVLRHQGISLAMGDEYWKKYKVGKRLKLKTMDGKNYVEANPIRVSPPGTPPEFASYNLEQFFKDGGIVLGCNLAFAEVVGRVQKEEKLDEKAAHERAMSMLIPGVQLQPSGVFAVLRAQEAGCKYILAS
jgi:hypothetical protein